MDLHFDLLINLSTDPGFKFGSSKGFRYVLLNIILLVLENGYVLRSLDGFPLKYIMMTI